jgi:nitroreductase
MAPGFDRTSLFASLLADTHLDAAALRAPLAPGTGPRPAPPGDEGVRLPAPAPAREGLEESLRRRTAIRAYTRQPVELAQLSAMLTAAEEQDRRNWSSERAAGVELRLVCASWRVAGLDTGLYGFDGGTRSLVRLAALPTGTAAEDIVLQREFAAAPALVLVLGNLAEAVRRHGSHGHRLLLTRAGAAAHAAWLAALSVGLDGTVFAGLLPGAVRDLLGADGYTTAPLFAFSVGWRADPDVKPPSRRPLEGGEFHGQVDR